MNVPNTLKFTGKDSSIVGSSKARLIFAIYEKLKINQKLRGKIKQEFSGQMPGIFVGSFGYPVVNTGFLSSEENAGLNNPLMWSKKGASKYGLLDIIKIRSELVNSNFSVNVKSFNKRLKDELKDTSLSIKPVDADINLIEKPSFRLNVSRDLLPIGPSAPLKKLSITVNPKIPRFVDKIESDTDLKAVLGVNSLFNKGFDEHYITKIFSGGNLGVKTERKLVPTKWSITAVDDTLGKNIISNNLKDFKEHDYAAFFGGYMGNYYLALIIPGPWSYELFETYVGKGLSNTSSYESASDYENPFGRKSYAQNTVGGYYAARLAVLEYFKKNKRVGRVLMLRFITDEYWAPLGVWVVREASRNSFKSTPLIFESIEYMLKYANLLTMKKYNLNLDVIFKKSQLLFALKNQKTLSKYIN